MSSRVFLLLGLLAAIVFFVSEAAARDLAETTSTDKNDANGVNDAKYPGGGYGGYPGGGYPGGGHGGGYPGHGGGGRGHGGGGRGRGRCYYGCCGGGYHGGCRCCASAAEAAQMATEVKPQN
ncbi:cold and drought-regulated protein CORA-like [Punica granatum]|uniref:Cold and drought-regulated protein CORA-like n=1 Tax=Punica granatum TaxID=22663 RepID=A0A6P8DD86_PUNGR|nr:cold and drought-regulated protein CORA-like [Punica granatum]